MRFVREQFYLAATAQNLKRLVRFLRAKPTPELATAWTRRKEAKEASNQAGSTAKGLLQPRSSSTDTPDFANYELTLIDPANKGFWA